MGLSNWSVHDRLTEWRLRRHCKRVLRELGIQPPLQVAEVCQLLGERRGRPLHLVPYPMPVPGPYGAWIATGTADYVLYQQNTTKPHQDHIILHEVGHILAGHRNDEDYPDEALWQQEMPDISPRTIRRALRRTSYEAVEEREAELIATIVLGWASVLDHVAPHAASEPSLRRIQAALGDRRGWL